MDDHPYLGYNHEMKITRTPIAWIGSSKKDYTAFPDDVQDVMGFALDGVQCGLTPSISKHLKGLGNGVYELSDDHKGDTYRAVYVVKFKDIVYVLHAFQKKSKKGVTTPKKDIDLVKRRLKVAGEDYALKIKED